MSIRALFCIFVLALPCMASHAAAGKVLLAVGDVVVVRNDRTLPLIEGTFVESGDTIRVGERSSVQLRMADKAMLSLRADTSVTLDNYTYGANAEQQRSFVTLLKGGLRAVTGLIARNNKDYYRLVTPTATLGVRGTDFTVVQCAGGCINADGSKAPDGLFGGVNDGRIVVGNRAGEKEIRKSEFFYVAAPTSAVQTLPAPPPFLRDPQDARNRAKSAGTSTPGSEKAEDKPKGSDVAVSTASEVAASSAPAAPTTAAAAPTATPLPSATVSTNALSNAPVVLGAAYSVSEAFTNGIAAIGQENTGFGQQPYVQTTRAVPVLEYRLTAQSWTDEQTASGTNPDGTTYTEVNRSTYVKSASVSVGNAPAAGNVQWGQYSLRIDFETIGGPNAGRGQSLRDRHWAIGDGVTSLPTSGSFTYNWVGGTNPTDVPLAVNGVAPPSNVGTLLSGGSIGVRFDNQTMSTLTPVQWNMPSGTRYSISFQNASWAPVVTTTTDPATGGTNRSLQYPIIDTTSSSACTGCTGLVATVSPTFYGATAQGLGLALATRSIVQGKTDRTSTVQVYKRP